MMVKLVCRLTICATILIASINCNQPAKKETDIAHFHAMLDNYWKGLMTLQPLDATQYGDNSLNDQFKNTCTQAYRDEVKNFYLGYLDSLKNFNPDEMSEEDALSYKVLKYDADM